MAKLYFRYGAMGSSKTANAIMVRHNYLERGQKVLMLKPRLDNRDGETIVASRCGLRCECAFIEDIGLFDVSQYDCLIVDECQFLTKQQVEYLVHVVDVIGVPVSATACALISRAICLRAASGCWPGRIPSKRSKPSAGAAAKPPATPASSAAKSSRKANRSCLAAMKATSASAASTGQRAC